MAAGSGTRLHGFTRERPLEDYAQALRLPERAHFGPEAHALTAEPLYAPGCSSWILHESLFGALTWDVFRWGIVPEDAPPGHRSRDEVRLETADRYMRRAFRSRRGIVPADGYTIRGGTRRKPQLRHISRSDGEPIFLAVLWSQWGETGTEGRRGMYVVLTQPAGPAFTALHARAPVLVRPQSWAHWIDADCDDPAHLPDLLVNDSELEQDLTVSLI